MYVCMYVCMHVYIYIYNIYIKMYICMNMYMYTHTHTHTHIYIYIYTYIYITSLVGVRRSLRQLPMTAISDVSVSISKCHRMTSTSVSYYRGLASIRGFCCA
jgi:hypothetical protein